MSLPFPSNRIFPKQGWRRWVFFLGLLFVAYSLVGFLIIPPILKWQLTKRLPEITKRQATIRQVKFNPWALSLTVRGLVLREANGRRFASWDEFYVNFQTSSLIRWAWTFKDIRLVRPYGEIILLPDGRLNFANLLQAPTNAPPAPRSPARVPRVNIFHLEVTNGFVAFEDRTRRSVFRTAYRPINLNLREFTTRPEADTPYAFRAESDAGRSITWAGDFAVQPLRSAGHLEVAGVQLPRYGPYFEDVTRAVLTNGLAEVQLDYRLTGTTNGVALTVTNAALQVAHLEVIDPETREIVAALQGLDVRPADFRLPEKTARLGGIRVSEASLLVRRKQNSHLNLLDLLVLPAATTNTLNTPVAPTTGGRNSLTVSLDEFTIERAKVAFEDLSRRTPFQTVLQPIETVIRGFSTAPEKDAQFSFRVTSEAAESVAGTGRFAINPVRSTGEIRLEAVDIKKYLPYLEDFFRGKIAAGGLSLVAPYYVSLQSGAPSGSVTNLNLSLTNLQVQLPESPETVTHIQGISFEQVDADLAARKGHVGAFTGNGGSITVRRQKDGQINLLGLLAVSKTNVPPNSTPERKAASDSAVALGGWTLHADQIKLNDYSLSFEDLALPKPAPVLLDQFNLSLEGFSNLTNQVIQAALAFRLNETAAFGLHGHAQLSPGTAEMELSVTNLDLRLVQPYLDPHVALSIASGSLSTSGKFTFQTNNPAAPRLAFVGGLRLTNLLTVDPVTFKEFLGFADLAVEGIDTTVAPTKVKTDTIRLSHPKFSVRIGTNRVSNLASILGKKPADTNQPAVAAVETHTDTNTVAGAIPIQVQTLALEGAALSFADDSVQPSVALGIEELRGTIKGLSSTFQDPAEVDLAGRFDAQSAFSIRGRINPFSGTRFVDLTITNSNTQLTPLTGYMEKYGGYPLKKGRLSTDLRYHVQGNALQAENKIHVDQLTLGAPTGSPEATKLPVKLGIALLKDAEGRIALDVPVQGKIDDPEFKLAPIILKVVVNMIVKAAASPFKLLGALAGGAGEELSFVAFSPGSTNLVDGEAEKLSKLADALRKRPALNVEVEGAIDPTQDRAALARQKLADQLKAERLHELMTQGRAPESVGTFQIEPAEHQRLLRAAFVKEFGTNVSAVIQENLARLSPTNHLAATPVQAQPKPKHGFFGRIGAFFGAGSHRSTKAEKSLAKADREALSLAPPELMEQLLAEKISISDDDFRQLMTARARYVQDWLVQTGQISADRLFLAAPKPVDQKYKGATQALLSLE